MSYKLCILALDQLEDLVVSENMFQWGYKILGEGYKLIEHRFDGSALLTDS